MTRFMNSLSASVALTIAVTSIAVNATTKVPLDHVQIEAHKALSGLLREIQYVVDVGGTHALTGQSI
jgi:hypothetical protein